MVSRRQFFSEFAQSLLAGVERAAAGWPPLESANDEDVQEWIRPPGALPEMQFLECCTKCNKCAQACPPLAIRRLGAEFGINADTPALVPSESPCTLCEDMPCVRACEDGALVLDRIEDAAMGTARWIEDACYVAQGQRCDYCVERCPRKGRAIGWDHRRMPIIDPEECAGCGVCAYLCPGEAIYIRPLKV